MDGLDMGGTDVTHCSANVAMMQGPTKTLGEVVSNVDLCGNAIQFDLLLGPPFLDGKCLHSNMPGARGGLGAVDNVDHGLIVFMQERWSFLGKPKLNEDRPKALGHLGSGDSSTKFSLC